MQNRYSLGCCCVEEEELTLQQVLFDTNYNNGLPGAFNQDVQAYKFGIGNDQEYVCATRVYMDPFVGPLLPWAPAATVTEARIVDISNTPDLGLAFSPQGFLAGEDASTTYEIFGVAQATTPITFFSPQPKATMLGWPRTTASVLWNFDAAAPGVDAYDHPMVNISAICNEIFSAAYYNQEEFSLVFVPTDTKQGLGSGIYYRSFGTMAFGFLNRFASLP
jgi:hypothetical protein